MFFLLPGMPFLFLVHLQNFYPPWRTPTLQVSLSPGKLISPFFVPPPSLYCSTCRINDSCFKFSVSFFFVLNISYIFVLPYYIGQRQLLLQEFTNHSLDNLIQIDSDYQFTVYKLAFLLFLGRKSVKFSRTSFSSESFKKISVHIVLHMWKLLKE